MTPRYPYRRKVTVGTRLLLAAVAVGALAVAVTHGLGVVCVVVWQIAISGFVALFLATGLLWLVDLAFEWWDDHRERR